MTDTERQPRRVQRHLREPDEPRIFRGRGGPRGEDRPGAAPAPRQRHAGRGGRQRKAEPDEGRLFRGGLRVHPNRDQQGLRAHRVPGGHQEADGEEEEEEEEAETKRPNQLATDFCVCLYVRCSR